MRMHTLSGECERLSGKGTQSLGEISSVRIGTVWLSETEISTQESGRCQDRKI